jgi:hypothetical protein
MGRSVFRHIDVEFSQTLSGHIFESDALTIDCDDEVGIN